MDPSQIHPFHPLLITEFENQVLAPEQYLVIKAVSPIEGLAI
jgi:hypothetical protein